MPDFDKIYLYRMVHIDNIPHILKHGITHVSSPNKNPEYTPIGDVSLIQTRSGFKLPNQKKLGDYIPFYFGARMPMLYVMQKGFNGVTPTLPQSIVYCVTSIGKIMLSGLEFVFSDGHAVNSFSTFYSTEDLSNIENIIDRNAIKVRDWVKEGDNDLKRRKEAEFLVFGDIPSDFIIGFIVYNEKAFSLLNKIPGIENKKVKVDKDCYF